MKHLMWIAPAAATLLVMTGCGQSASPAASASPPSTANSSAASSGTSNTKPAEKIKVSFASNSAEYASYFVAMDNGYFADQGLDIQMVSAGGGVATPALISGDLAYSTSASSTIGAIIKGAPLKVVYTNADRPGYELWTNSPDIKTMADVKGKTIGIQTRGDTFEVAMDIYLKQHGMQPSDVGYTPLGTGNARLAALESGSLPLALLGVADVVEFQKAGGKGHMVVDLKKDVQMLYTGLATSDKELKDHPDRVKRFLTATVQGRMYYQACKSQTLQVMAKYNKRSTAANEADYDDVVAAMTKDGAISSQVQEADEQVRASLLNITQLPPVSNLYDYSVITQVYKDLQTSGWKPQC